MLTKELKETLGVAVDEAVSRRHEYVTIEHLLYALLDDKTARNVLYHCGANLEKLRGELNSYLNQTLEKLPDNVQLMPELTSTCRASFHTR